MLKSEPPSPLKLGCWVMSLEAGPFPHSSKLCSEEKPGRKAVWTHHVPGYDEEMEMRTRLLGEIAVSCCLSLAWSA